MTDLSGRFALVTGGSGGIGRAIVLALAARGARLIIHYNESRQAAAEVADLVRAGGGEAHCLQADLAAADGPHRLAAQVAAVSDHLHALVANAAAGTIKPFEATTIEEFDLTFAINARAPFFLVQQLAPLFGEGSSVILVSSAATRFSIEALEVYGASKGALEPLVQSLAAGFGGKGVRVNSVLPGFTQSPMSEPILGTEDGRAMVLGLQALKRIAQPEDIADVIAFLASDEARWITGQHIRVDGGLKL